MSVPIAPELLLPAGPQPEPAPARERRTPAAARHQARPAHAAPRSGLERVRAAAVTTAAQVGLAAIEQATVSGKGDRLRKAVRRLPPGLARGSAAVAEDETAAADDDARAETHRGHAAEQGAERPAAHGRESSGGQPASARLDLPLPDGGEARVAVEVGEGGSAAQTYRVDVQLELAQLGAVDVHLVADDSRLLCRVDCADPEARARLDDALAALRDELAAATGKSVGVALDRPEEPDAPRLAPLGGLDAYA